MLILAEAANDLPLLYFTLTQENAVGSRVNPIHHKAFRDTCLAGSASF